MNSVICMLRGVNVGGHNKIKMTELRDLCLSLNLEEARTFIQSGNVVFRTMNCNRNVLSKCIGDGIEKQFGFRPDVVLRTADEMRSVIKQNPFASRKDVEPNKLLIWFLAAEPAAEARAKVLAMPPVPEELHINKSELYIYFPNGMARPRLSLPAIGRTLKVPGTGRNWNSVLKMMAMAEELEV